MTPGAFFLRVCCAAGHVVGQGVRGCLGAAVRAVPGQGGAALCARLRGRWLATGWGGALHGPIAALSTRWRIPLCGGWCGRRSFAWGAF